MKALSGDSSLLGATCICPEPPYTQVCSSTNIWVPTTATRRASAGLIDQNDPRVLAANIEPPTVHGPSTTYPYHLIFLAETREGYANLCRLVSATHLAHPERKDPPVVTGDSLRAYTEGLICLTACRQGEVGYLVDAGHEKDAHAVLCELQDIFGSNHLYVELQYFGYCPPRQTSRPHYHQALHKVCYAAAIANNTADHEVGFYHEGSPWCLSCLTYCERLLPLAQALELKTVLTNNVHYAQNAERCFRGIARRYKPIPPQAVELLENELRMIEKLGFSHYFLITHDIVRWARARGIPCSGRGSAGNSIICYALDITASDPLHHHLLFERFLNPNRREMPDIDVDFCSVRREEVVKYIYKTFGEENVAVVANVNTTTPCTALKDGLHPEGRYARFLDLVERLDSFPLHLSTHLGGFVIADRPIAYYTPLQWAAKGVVITQFNKDDIAALGLVKMDILGLRTHSAVSECVQIIEQRTGRKIQPYELPLDDPATYEIIKNGGSVGLFQLESPGQRNLAYRLQEETFDDIIHQEQVLRIARDVAGFDLAEADSLRRAMTRDRRREEMERIGKTFVKRAIDRGVPEEAAREVFRQLEGFAAYGFNKSHSCASQS